MKVNKPAWYIKAEKEAPNWVRIKGATVGYCFHFNPPPSYVGILVYPRFRNVPHGISFTTV